MKRPVTTATVIALALGTAAVVAPATHAADYGLRGEDGAGVIARGEQMASDLPAGSCVVEASGVPDAASGNQAGFSWTTLEPGVGHNNTDPFKWGLSVAFDNSKDRTFANWYFTNGGKLGPNLQDRVGYLDVGEVPSMDAGQSSYDVNGKPTWTTTHKADEAIEITNPSGRGPQRNLNLYAELTDEKVKQFASATADDPVRYGWLSNYNKDNSSGGMKATQGVNAGFGALVNPWPSENNECNPITTTWDKIENHVITPGDETKVGHINVPKLSDETQDDSLGRMVVEAYSTDGKFIGTSDKAAGEKTRLRVANNGDVFFTWPDYRDPNNGVVANQNVQFSVVALPRSVEQLQAAAKHTLDWYPEGRQYAFESSNSLPRYNTPNEIDKHTITLDDTTKHDPQYEEPTRTFVSGVIDGAPSDERKEIVFTQVGNEVTDLIANMVEREGVPNNKIKVELDTTYVYSGWTAEFVDPDNGNYDVRVTAPANPRAGEFARPLVKVSYTNGSEDHIPILVIVDPNHTQQMNLAYERVPVATPGEPYTVDAKLTRAIGDGDIIAPAKYVLDKAGLPDGWTAEVDQATGNVVITPSVNAPNGEQFIGTVTATYPDGTTDTAEVNVMAVSAVKTANYDAATLYPGTPVELHPSVADTDAVGGTDGPAPTKYTFAGGKTTTEQKGVKLTIDPDTGVITADAGGEVPNGTHVKVPVEMTFPIGPVQTTNAEVVTVVAPTRPVPFEVETIFDDTVPAGEARVTREGEQGTEAVQEDGSWKVTKKPVNAQVTVGTKPATATATQTWTLPVPFDTERKANPDLKPGETRVVQKGVAGERKLTVNVTATGDTAEIAPETVTREPVTEIIEYGPDNADRESVTTRKVPFTTKIIYDPELPEGTNRTEQEGKDGTVKTTATQRVVDGTPDGDPVITEDVTDAVEMIVRVGTKKVETDVVTEVEQPIPAPTRVVFDPTLTAGEHVVDSEGTAGTKVVTVSRTITGGEVTGNPSITERVTQEPVERVVRVGTKPTEATKRVTWTAEIPFAVTVLPNDKLAAGETKVVQQGKAGTREFAADFNAVGADGKVETTERTTAEPVEHVVEYGPGAADGDLVTVTERDIPFATDYVIDRDLADGEQVVEREGTPGKETITATQVIESGRPAGKPAIDRKATDPVNKVVRVGVKPAPKNTQVTSEFTDEVPAPVKVVYDDTVPAGETVVRPGEEGAAGEKTITITHKVVDGVATGEPTVDERVTKQPTERVLRVGTKPADPITAPDALRWTVPLPYPTELRANPEMAPGEIREVRPGKDGSATFAAKFAIEGKTTTTATEEGRTEPVARIVEYGPRSGETPVVNVTERAVEFATKVVEDPSLPKGEQVIEQGEFGRERVTVTRSVKDGKVGEPVETVERVTEPKDAVIRVGTGKRKAVDADVEIPFGTRVVFDPNLEPGKQVEDTPGKPGTARVTFKDGKAAVNVVTQPVERVVRVGSKPGVYSWTERVPFGIEVRENPDRAAGEHEIVREGEEGTRVHVGDEVTDTKKPVDMIVEVGTKQPDEPAPVVTEVDVPYTTRIVYDPSLAAGEEVEDVAGRDGTLRITAKDGDSTVEEARPMVQRVVRVGTKPTTPTWTERVPFEVEVRENPDRPAGEHEVVREGVPGTIEHTDGKAVTVTEAVNMVIEVGTKQPDTPTPPAPEPQAPAGSSDTAKRCVANATAANSPLLWLLPVALLGGVGYGVNTVFAPQIAQAQAQWNAAFNRNNQGGRGIPEPEWVRSARAQADAFARQFAGAGEDLRPVATALGVIAALAAVGGLTYQACQEDGFDAWFGPASETGSSKN